MRRERKLGFLARERGKHAVRMAAAGSATIVNHIEGLILSKDKQDLDREVERVAGLVSSAKEFDEVAKAFFATPPQAGSDTDEEGLHGAPIDFRRRRLLFVKPDERAPAAVPGGSMPGETSGETGIGPVPASRSERRSIEEVELAGRVLASAILQNSTLAEPGAKLAEKVRSWRLKDQATSARIRKIAADLADAVRASGTRPGGQEDPEAERVAMRAGDLGRARELGREYDMLLASGHRVRCSRESYIRRNLGNS